MTKLADHFYRHEFLCKCGSCGFDTVDAALLRILREARLYFKAPIIINSGCRCKLYNGQVGGSPNSQHTIGRAADIVVTGVTPQDVQWYFTGRYLNRYGIGMYDDFTHIDTRTKGPARW